jgi:hypothetical protein
LRKRDVIAVPLPIKVLALIVPIVFVIIVANAIVIFEVIVIR